MYVTKDVFKASTIAYCDNICHVIKGNLQGWVCNKLFYQFLLTLLSMVACGPNCHDGSSNSVGVDQGH
jgi:hypothetical protein